jgi:hypothetical protein
MSLEETARRNMEQKFEDNPCRGIVLGMNSDGVRIAITWASERRDYSRNMRFIAEQDAVKTEPADPTRKHDPTPAMYSPMIQTKGGIIVGNADQTGILYDSMKDFSEAGPGSFFGTLSTLCCLPDTCIFTPRISGYLPIAPDSAYLSLLKADAAEKERWISILEEKGLKREDFRKSGMSESDITLAFNKKMGKLAGIDAYNFPTTRDTFERTLTPGYGFCLTTYNPGSSELSSFEGEPFVVPVRGSIEQVMEYFWNVQKPDWRIAICGMSIDGKKFHVADPINSAQEYRHKKAGNE